MSEHSGPGPKGRMTHKSGSVRGVVGNHHPYSTERGGAFSPRAAAKSAERGTRARSEGALRDEPREHCSK